MSQNVTLFQIFGTKLRLPFTFRFGSERLSEPVRAGFQKRKQKQSSLSVIFFRISFIPNYFNRNRNRKRFVPVTIESVTICDICDQYVTKPVLPEKLTKKQRNKFGHKLKFVTVCDRRKCHKLVTHSV